MKRAWTVPAMVAALTMAGLLSGLLADGMGDALAWIGLLMPTLVGVRLVVLKHTVAIYPRHDEDKD